MQCCVNKSNLHKELDEDKSNLIFGHYCLSKLYPNSINRKNIIINETTTLEELEIYCSKINLTISSRSIDAFVAIAMAAKVGNLKLLDALIAKCGKNIINKLALNYHSLIYIVVNETRVSGAIYNIQDLCKGVKKLIELGAPINSIETDGFTCLAISALKVENFRLTSLLLQNEAVLSPCTSHLSQFSFESRARLHVYIPITANINRIKLLEHVQLVIKLVRKENDEGSSFLILPKEIREYVIDHFFNVMGVQARKEESM